MRLRPREDAATAAVGLDRWLVSKDPVEQELATATLRQMGVDDEVTYLSRVIASEEKRRKALSSGLTGGIWLGYQALRLYWTFSGFDHDRSNTAFQIWFSLAVLLAYFGLLFGLQRTRRCKEAIRRIAATNDPRALPSLVDAFTGWRPMREPAIASSIASLLSRLKEIDGLVLDLAQWKALADIVSGLNPGKLGWPAYETLAKATLRALALTGKASCRKQVRRAANYRGSRPEGRAIAEAARKALVVLDDKATLSRRQVLDTLEDLKAR